MNWRRGMMRTYLALWVLWAVTMTWAGILGNLRYSPATKMDLVRVPGPPDTAATDTTLATDKYWDYREVPVGPPRLHFEGLGFGQAMATFGLAFALPAILLIALRWIVRGFRGPGASGG